MTVGTGLRLSGWVSTPQWMEIGELAARGARQNGHVFSILRSGKCLDSTHEIMTIIEQSHKGRTDGRKRVQYSTVQYKSARTGRQFGKQRAHNDESFRTSSPLAGPRFFVMRSSTSSTSECLEEACKNRLGCGVYCIKDCGSV